MRDIRDELRQARRRAQNTMAVESRQVVPSLYWRLYDAGFGFAAVEAIKAQMWAELGSVFRAED